MTSTQRLNARRTELLADLHRQGGTDRELGERIEVIDRELRKLATRRRAARARRELLFDLNGHHGPA
jgi:hypothetical protein